MRAVSPSASNRHTIQNRSFIHPRPGNDMVGVFRAVLDERGVRRAVIGPRAKRVRVVANQSRDRGTQPIPRATTTIRQLKIVADCLLARWNVTARRPVTGATIAGQ